VVSETSTSEFFRHLRPQWFDLSRRELKAHPNGGVSFLLVPVAERTYDFWVNICPEDAPFSSRHAVDSLRKVRAAGTAPFGQLQLDERPIFDQLVEEVRRLAPPPYELGRYVSKISLLREVAARAQARHADTGAKKEYENG
jgi:hypothetical protein